MKKIINKAGLSSIWIKKLPAKTSIHIFFLGLMILFATANAAEENWVFVSEREDDLWFVNTDSIMCRGNLCKASVKMQPLTEKYEYTIEANEYTCTEMKYKTLRTTTYDSNRNIVKSITPEGQGWNYIVSGSVSKELYEFVCKKVPNLKEQLTGEKMARKYEAEKPVDLTKKVQLQDAVLPKEVESQTATAEDKEGTSLQSQKPSEVIFTVQAGAFKNASYAKAFETLLKEKGYSAYMTLSESKERGELYKVYIGEFSERKEAKTLSEKIRKSEGIQTFVTSLQP